MVIEEESNFINQHKSTFSIWPMGIFWKTLSQVGLMASRQDLQETYGFYHSNMGIFRILNQT